jgi:hypothetical protein
MPAAALVVTGKKRRGRQGRSPGIVCIVLGVGCIVGTLVEPVTYRRRPSSPAIRAAIVCNLASSLVLTAAAIRYVAAEDGSALSTPEEGRATTNWP